MPPSSPRPAAPDLPTQIEAHPCPTCAAPPNSACRTASGNTAFRYHTPRLLLVPELTDPEVLVPADRAPGTPWQSPHTDERFGYASGPSAADTRTQHDVLRAHGCARIFIDHAPFLAATRPERDRALSAAAAAAASAEAASASTPATPHAPARAAHGPAILTVVTLSDLARNASELAEVATALATSGVRLEILDGSLAGLHDPHSPSSTAAGSLFTVLGATRMLDLAYARERNAAGRRAAEAEGRRSGRPRVIDEALLAQAIALRDEGVPVPQIAQRLVIASGKHAGEHPSLASVYRALATYDGTTEPKRVAI